MKQGIVKLLMLASIVCISTTSVTALASSKSASSLQTLIGNKTSTKPTASPKQSVTTTPTTTTKPTTTPTIVLVSTRTTTVFPYQDYLTVAEAQKYQIQDFLKSDGTTITTLDTKKNVKSVPLKGSSWEKVESISTFMQRMYQLDYRIQQAWNPGYLNGGFAEEDVMEDPLAESAEAPVMDIEAGSAPTEATDDQAYQTVPETSGDYSTTTTQEANVDEADKIKTDGKYIYYMSSKGVAIIEGGEKPKQIGTIKANAITDSMIQFDDLYCNGTKLVVMGTSYSTSYNSNFLPMNWFFVYDLTDPTKPKQIRKVGVEGNIQTTRLYNNSVYFVSNIFKSNWLQDRENSSILSVLPIYVDSAIGEETYVLQPKNLYLPTGASKQHNYGSQYVLLGEFSLLDDTPVNLNGYYQNDSGYNTNIYMNQKSLYWTINQYTNTSETSSTVNTATVTPQPTFTWQEKTLISRFSIEKNGLTFQCQGTIPGYLLNQYSMDEYKDTLRVATTERKNNTVSNNIYTLDAKTMKQLGFVENLAKGETIKSTRFRGETAYMVTYRDTDPLFVIDLSNAKKPNVLGELKIPGFSTYLHPYGTDRLIGIGIDTKELFSYDDKGNQISSGTRDGGIKISLFDISNPKKPKEVDKLQIGNYMTSSIATWDPKAIMFDMKANKMAFPIDYHGTENWQGGLVVSLSPNKLAIDSEVRMDTSLFGDSSRFAYINNILYYVTDQHLVSMDYTSYDIKNILPLQYE